MELLIIVLVAVFVIPVAFWIIFLGIAIVFEVIPALFEESILYVTNNLFKAGYHKFAELKPTKTKERKSLTPYAALILLAAFGLFCLIH